MAARNAPKLSPRLLLDPVHLLALGFGSGLAPKAPGTAGSLVALPLVWWLASLPLLGRAGFVVVLVAAGIWICGESARRIGVHDHPGIVLDEIAAMAALSLVLPPTLPALAAAFVLFRVFDIAKPWPIRDLDHRLGGGLGIMLDDIAAAAFTAVGIAILDFLLQRIA